ncbi:MAG: FecR domain-containing protein, partial [Caulobacter sp.]
MRLDREGETPELLAALDEWRAADTRRRGALLQAQGAWHLLDRSRTAPQNSTNSRNAPAWRSPARWLGGAGAIAAALVAAVLVLPGQRYNTAVGEIRRVPLKDGSTAAINTQSAIAVDLGAHERRVKVERGEAWFQVAKNPQSP